MNLLKLVWKIWRAFGKKMADIYAYIIYGLFYIILMLIPGVISVTYLDLLNMKSNPSRKSNFVTWVSEEESLEDSHLQF